MIDAEVWKDGTISLSRGEVRSYEDARGLRHSTDFPVSPFVDAAAGERGMLWATSAGAIYRTADPVAPLEPVEGLRTWAVAAAGEWGAACNDGALFRIPLDGPPVAEPMGRACKTVESTRGRIFVQDATWWSSTSDLEGFASELLKLAIPRAAVGFVIPPETAFEQRCGPMVR